LIFLCEECNEIYEYLKKWIEEHSVKPKPTFLNIEGQHITRLGRRMLKRDGTMFLKRLSAFNERRTKKTIRF
jgi:hypothetical protein